NWLLVNGGALAVNGTTNGSLVVSVNPAGLPAGTCNGKLTFTATVAGTGAAVANSPLIVPVTLYVSNTALLVTPSIAPAFTAPLGATSVAPQNITLSSTSPTDQLSYTITVPPPSSGGNWLAVTPLSGSTPGTVTLVAVPTLLSPGTYAASIVVTA